MEKLRENEWAKLSESELERCANWEFQRECSRLQGLQVEPAWLDLTRRQKLAWRKHCFVAKFGPPMPAVFQDFRAFGAEEKMVRGKLVTSAEVLEIGINWERSDGAIIDGFRKWLSHQRKTNPSARSFKKRGGGNRESPLSVLVSIAMLRAHDDGISRENAKKGLSDLIARAACASRFESKYYKEKLHAARKMFL